MQSQPGRVEIKFEGVAYRVLFILQIFVGFVLFMVT